MGRAAFGGSETEATTGWTAGKPWEIALGEHRGSAGAVGGAPLEGARWKRRTSVGWEGGTGFAGQFQSTRLS